MELTEEQRLGSLRVMAEEEYRRFSLDLSPKVATLVIVSNYSPL